MNPVDLLNQYSQNPVTSLNQNFTVGTQYSGRTYKDPNDSMVASWTEDSSKGDSSNFTVKDGKIMYPIWKNSLTGIKETATNSYNEMTNPNSSYYQNISKQIRSQLTGAMSPDSLLAQTVAMGGSPAQAQEQIKATQSKITDSAGTLLNNYYLNASSNASSLLNTSLSAEELQTQKDLYKKQQENSLWNNILSIGATIGGTVLAGPIGGAAAYKATSGSTITPTGSTYYY